MGMITKPNAEIRKNRELHNELDHLTMEVTPWESYPNTLL